MASNRGNRYITLLALVLRAIWSTHTEVNGMDQKKGKNGDRNRDRNGKGGPAGAAQGRER